MTDTDERVGFSTSVDLEVEQKAILAFYSELIKYTRQLPPKLTLYRNNKAFLSITSRGFEQGNKLDRNRAIMDMFYIVPATQPDLAILAFGDAAPLISGVQDCVIVISVNKTGALGEVFPWEISNGENVEYNMEASLAVGSQAYCAEIEHMLPVFFTAKDSAFEPTDVLGYLMEQGNEVELYSGLTMDNIDRKFNLYQS